MMPNNDLPIVLVKRKNIQTIFDYCMDNKIEFSVKEKPFTVEEFEVTLNIEEIKQAISLGIFARENRIEIVGVNDKQQAQSKPARKTTTAPVATTPAMPAVKPMEVEEEKEEQQAVAFTNSNFTEEVEPFEEPKTENRGFSLDLSSSPSLSFS